MGEADIQQDYVVLARKYRSQTFSELIGQEALVRTLTNAIAANKIHHAYVFTGIRGVGKTSTARLLAMALNCENGPSITWDENDPQVQAIKAGNHVDVLEYDAASNRGVEEVAQLFEGVNYAPVVGRYKVYIIDEVHMLSNHAFNALLKTLEEPPARVKFIFATTEVQKIPVTVLSRCQRFDLKRIPSEILYSHFMEILGKEQIEAEPEAVRMIAHAADGSARDGLSLLDQAMALGHGGMITGEVVSGMLGLADRARVYDVLEAILSGDSKGLMDLLDGLYAQGQDAGLLVEGMLETAHLLTRLKVVQGLNEAKTLSEIERTRAVPLAAKVGLANLSRIYQVLLQVSSDVKVAARPYEALTMGLVRLAYLAPLPPLEKLAEAVEQARGESTVGAMKVQLSTVKGTESAREETHVPPVAESAVPGEQRAPWEGEVTAATPSGPTDWAGVVKAIEKVKPGLAAALKDRVKCVGLEATVAGGSISVVVERGLMPEAELLKEVRSALGRALGEGWGIGVASDGAAKERASSVPTLARTEALAAEARKVDAAQDPSVAAALAMFPGAEVVDVQIEEEM